METKDLMIGDWVKISHLNKIGKVYRIDRANGKGNGFAAVIDGDYYEGNLEPIPLTPEILEKNGFTKSTPPPGIHAICYELDNKKDRYNLTIADYNKYKRLLLHVDSEDSECFNIKCDYVHKLQHALHLCGIKKEIVL